MKEKKTDPIIRRNLIKQPIPIAASQAATLRKTIEKSNSFVITKIRKKTKTNLSKANKSDKIFLVFTKKNKKTLKTIKNPYNIMQRSFINQPKYPLPLYSPSRAPFAKNKNLDFF